MSKALDLRPLDLKTLFGVSAAGIQKHYIFIGGRGIDMYQNSKYPRIVIDLYITILCTSLNFKN